MFRPVLVIFLSMLCLNFCFFVVCILCLDLCLNVYLCLDCICCRSEADAAMSPYPHLFSLLNILPTLDEDGNGYGNL